MGTTPLWYFKIKTIGAFKAFGTAARQYADALQRVHKP